MPITTNVTKQRLKAGKMGLGFGTAIRAKVQSDRNRKISAGRLAVNHVQAATR